MPASDATPRETPLLEAAQRPPRGVVRAELHSHSKVPVMKLIQSLIVAVAMVAPVAAFAQASQANQPLTRAQVQAELVQLEKAGYTPARNDLHYPDDIQAAQARVDAQNVQNAQNAGSAYGGVANGSSASGAASKTSFTQSQDDVPGLGPIFAHP